MDKVTKNHETVKYTSTTVVKKKITKVKDKQTYFLKSLGI